jgi:phosphotriesterase-related protein
MNIRAANPLYSDFYLDDEQAAIWELLAYHEAGGRTLVELTVYGIPGRDLAMIQRISHRTGVHVILGTGWYTEPFYPPEVHDLTIEKLAALLVHNLARGFEDTGFRAGIIGEIGTRTGVISYPEEKVFRAAALAHHETGAAITTHTENGELAMEQVRLLRSLGVPPERIVIGHLDNRIDRVLLEAVAAEGVYVEFDGIGQDYYSEVRRVKFPDDEERVTEIAHILERGYLQQVLLSSDICRQRHLRKNGGFGYDHVLRRFVPMLLSRGLTREQVHTMLVDNPRRVLGF